jgi:hypothetical protein
MVFFWGGVMWDHQLVQVGGGYIFFSCLRFVGSFFWFTSGFLYMLGVLRAHLRSGGELGSLCVF